MSLKFDPEFLEVLSTLPPNGPPPALHDIAARRRDFDAKFGALSTMLPDCLDVDQREFWVNTADGNKIKIIGFTKKGSATTKTSALLHFHAGGLILGSVDTFSKIVAMQVSATGVPVYSVDYRLAPEHPGLTPVDDSYASLLWLRSQADSLNIDLNRIGVIGESAGGGLAAGVALMARDNKLSPPLAKQILIYPLLDDRTLTPNLAIEPMAIWSTEDNITAWTALLGHKAGTADVPIYCAPARAPDLSGLPSTYIEVGQLDIFRDEDMRYAQRIAQANVSIEFHLYPGLPHAFEGIAPQIGASKRAVENRFRAISSF
ncbi:arylesterase/monooxygenase [Leptodontidium sp. MPI-SDFR-AT-0119]|nr:arylesterase/monooxygenase [Leptodontidium sp. MPI-SDFR-AT-0119]